MSMTFNSLVKQIQSYLNRTDQDTLDQIPNFIRQAEEKICRQCKTIGFEVYVTGNFEPGISVLPKPGRWRRHISFNFGTSEDPILVKSVRNPILLRSYEYLRTFWPDPFLTDKPQFYSDYGFSSMLIAPTPDEAYPFEYSYLELPQPLSPSNQTNWLTEYASGALLYGSLLETASFLKDDERIPVWEKYYLSEIQAIQQTDTLNMQDRSADREND